MGSVSPDAGRRGDPWWGRGWALALTLLVCAPFLGRGHVLSYDMVFVADPVLNDRALAFDGQVPRAVPADALLAALSGPVPSWVVQQLLLVGILVAGFLGAWRLAPTRGPAGAAATSTLYGWNVYVAERLVQGHWSLLAGWALLPWLTSACLRLRHDRSWATLARVPVLLGLAAAAAPTAGALAAGLAVVLVLALRVPWRTRLAVTGAAVLLNAAWWVPGALNVGAATDPAAGVEAFAARSDTPLGGLVSVATFGGIWNGLVVPDTRELVTSPLVTLALLAVAAAGVATLVRLWGRRAVVGLAVVALVGLGIAALSLSAAGREATVALVEHVPGAGILRDAQKWVAWWLLAASAAVGVGAERLLRSFPRPSRRFLLGCVVLGPLLALPAPAWGVSGRLEASRWPTEFHEVAELLDSRSDTGAVLVLPWHAFRAWDWNDDRAVLDPWQRMVRRDVVVRDDLELADGVVPGEDPVAAEVAALGDRPGSDDLRALGVRYVVEDLGTYRVPPEVEAPAGTVLHEGEHLRLRDLGPVEVDARPRRHVVVMTTVWSAVLVAWFAALAVAATPRLRPRRLLRLQRQRQGGKG